MVLATFLCMFKSPSINGILSLVSETLHLLQCLIHLQISFHSKVTQSHVWGVWRLPRLFNAVFHQKVTNELKCMVRAMLWWIMRDYGEQSYNFPYWQFAIGEHTHNELCPDNKKVINMTFKLLCDYYAFFDCGDCGVFCRDDHVFV